MLILEHTAPIYLNRAPADMRKSFDGLLGLVQQAGLADPLSGAWFVFRNRRGDRLKILYFDRDGLVIGYKRLERGRFKWPCVQESVATVEVPLSQLRLILEGIDLSTVRRRWSRSEIASQPVDNCITLDKHMDGAMVSAKQDDTANSNDARISPVDHQHAMCGERADVTGHREVAGAGGMADASDVRPQEREAAGSPTESTVRACG